MLRIALAVLLILPTTSFAQAYPELGPDAELRLAMSAGAPAIAAGAAVYLFGADGFRREIDGTNGWACLVVRSAANRIQLAPHCLNPSAVETVLPAMLLEGELQAAGLESAEIEAEMKRQWSTGELPLPSGPAYATMLSAGQVLGVDGGNFRPHFMLYVPYATNDDVGGSLENMSFPFVGPFEGHPLSTVVILMEEFVRPEDVVIPRR